MFSYLFLFIYCFVELYIFLCSRLFLPKHYNCYYQKLALCTKSPKVHQISHMILRVTHTTTVAFQHGMHLSVVHMATDKAMTITFCRRVLLAEDINFLQRNGRIKFCNQEKLIFGALNSREDFFNYSLQGAKYKKGK